MKYRTIFKRTGLALLIIGLLGAVFTALYLWSENNTLTDERDHYIYLSEQSAPSPQQEDPTGRPTDTQYEYTLSPDLTLSPPLTDEGSQIVLWGSPFEDTTVYNMSHKSIIWFMSTIDNQVATEICGHDALRYNHLADTTISYGGFVVSDGQLVHSMGQYASCFYTLASEHSNPNEELRREAQAIREQVDADIQAFLESATLLD